MSLRRVAASLIAAGVNLPPAHGTISSFSPFEKNSGAPHSSVATCAVSEQITLW